MIRTWFKGGAAHFASSDYKDYATAGDHKEGLIRVSGVHWVTNLDIDKRHDEIFLFKEYNEEIYLKYDNFNAINVDKTKDIPKDYYGNIGVPITFMDKYNPDQFEIIGIMSRNTIDEYNKGYPYVSGKRKHARIIIRRKNEDRT